MKWSSQLGFMFAAVGAAVGIGNIWRFPAVLGQNGGGAYLIPYLLAMAVLAVPFMVLELAAGRRFRGSVVASFRSINNRLTLFGWLIQTIVFTILSYYLVITGWTLAYAVVSATGNQPNFDDFTSGYLPLLSFGVSVSIAALIVSFGVRVGIEKVAKVVIPLAFGILVIMAAYALTLSGFGEAIRYLFSPDLSVLAKPSVWSAAIGQSFFSLSVGFGMLLVYAAYLDQKTDLFSSAWIIAVIDLSVALLAGIVIFTIVFTSGGEPAVGAELAFTALPKAFADIPAGEVLGFAFFLVLFLAALTSAVSMLEATVAAVTEATALTRTPVCLILALALIGLGLPAALSYSAVGLQIGDIPVLDYMDDTLGSSGLPLAALIMVIVFAWFGPRELVRNDLLTGPARRFAIPTQVLIKYVSPIALLLITLHRLATSVGFTDWGLVPRLVRQAFNA